MNGTSFIAARHAVIVIVAAIVPAFAACGARTGALDLGAENAVSQSAGPIAPSASATDTPDASPADTGPPASTYGTMSPGSSGFPCTATTTEYYSDSSSPPPEHGCHDMWTPSRKHAQGSVVTIVAPDGAACDSVQCVCGADDQWQPQTNSPASGECAQRPHWSAPRTTGAIGATLLRDIRTNEKRSDTGVTTVLSPPSVAHPPRRGAPSGGRYECLHTKRSSTRSTRRTLAMVPREKPALSSG